MAPGKTRPLQGFWMAVNAMYTVRGTHAQPIGINVPLRMGDSESLPMFSMTCS
jgi:hypothetical protein